MYQWLGIYSANIPEKRLRNGKCIANKVLSEFQFKNLMEFPPEAVSSLLTVLNYSLYKGKLFENSDNLCYSIEFALMHISHFTKTKDNPTLSKLIKFLNRIFLRMNSMCAINLQVDVSRIFELIIPLLEHETLKCKAVLLLSSALSIQQIVFSDIEIVNYCIGKCFKHLEPDSRELPPFILAALRAVPQSKENNCLYNWLYRYCPELLQSATHGKEILLNCIASGFERKDKENFELTRVYAYKISLLYRLMKNEMLYMNIMKIFGFIIQDLVKCGVFPPLEREYAELIVSEVNGKHCTTPNNIMFAINYLRICLYPREVDKEEIRSSIISKCLHETSYPSITLKALCLLYPLCFKSEGGGIISDIIGSNILNAAEQYCDLSNIMIYHISQLRWFLVSNRAILRIKALEFYLLNFDDDTAILRTLKATNTMEVLVDCLLNDVNPAIPKRAAHLLSQLECPETSSLIKRKLPLSIRYETCMGYLFKAKPALPELGKEGMLFCTMLARVLPALNDKEAFIGTCHYCCDMLVKFKACPWAVNEFILNEDCVVRLYEASSKDDEEVALIGLQLLIIFVKLQRRHSIKVDRTIPIDFTRLLQGSSAKLMKSINLLNLLLAHSRSTWTVSISKDHTLNIYQHLLQLQCADIYCQVFDALIKLQKTYLFLAYLSSTMLYMEIHCSQIYKTADQNQKFSLLVIHWLETIMREEIYPYDTQNISAFLASRQTTHQIQKLMLKLKGNFCGFQ